MAQIVSLTQEEAASSGFTHSITLLAADFAALTSATAYSIYPAYNATTTNPNMLVSKFAVFVKTAFNAFQSDGSTAVTLVVTVGDGTTANLFIASTTIKTAAMLPGANTTPKVPAGDIIKITPTWGASGDPTKTSAGELRILLSIVDGDTLCR